MARAIQSIAPIASDPIGFEPDHESPRQQSVDKASADPSYCRAWGLLTDEVLHGRDGGPEGLIISQGNYERICEILGGISLYRLWARNAVNQWWGVRQAAS